jgi:3-hydroxyisobutyrate dehydrogenase
MGDVGSGQVTKICNQLIVAANAMLIAEAVALAENNGVDASLLAPALAGGFADSLPLQILAPRMAARQAEPVQWKVATLLKDLDNAGQLSKQSQSATPLAALASQLMRLHAAQGHAMADLSSVINLYQESGNHVEALRQPQHAVQPPAVAAALCRRPRRRFCSSGNPVSL